MIAFLVVALAFPVGNRAMLKSVPADARATAGNVLAVFDALALKDAVALNRLRAFRSEVSRAGGLRYPVLEWDSSLGTYLAASNEKLRFRVASVDATPVPGGTRVVFRFERFLDRRDDKGEFGSPGKVLTTTERLCDTFTLRSNRGTWTVVGYVRDSAVKTEAGR